MSCILTYDYLVRLMEFLQLTRRAKLAPVKGIGVDPFRNLPNELLSRIFVLCSDSPLLVLSSRVEDPHQHISQVCSRWRQVALSTRALWSNIYVGKFDAEHPYYAHSLRLYRTWVGRAGDYPLTVSIHIYSSLYQILLDFIVPIRIKKLDITMPFYRSVDLPSLSVEEIAIAEINVLRAAEDLKASLFMDKIRHICIWNSAIEECEP